MPESMRSARPRIALVFGDDGSAERLRASVAEHVDVVYATPAAKFDPASLRQSGASAALVNLDAFDWLDAIAARLNEAGVAVVFNDPEISSTLEGWERARWLRHLVAKLSGSRDFDPPRPVVAAPTPDSVEASPEPASESRVATPDAPGGAASADQTGMLSAANDPELEPAPVAPEPSAAAGDSMDDVLSPGEPVIAERPLSPAEIESMTVAFVAAPAPEADAPAAAAAEASPMLEAVPGLAAEATPPMDAQDDPELAALDIDTEALSAMIDARLAEAERDAPPGPVTAWQGEAHAEPAAVAADPVDAAPEAAAEPPTPVVDAPASPPAGPEADIDDDVAKGFPALGDWALVDPELPVPASDTGAKPAPRSEPAVSIDFSGLELVPMDTSPSIEVHTDPIEHRLYVEQRKNAEAAGEAPASPGSKGEHA